MPQEYYLPAGYAACRFRFSGSALDHEASFTLHFNASGVAIEAIQASLETHFIAEIMTGGTAMSDMYNFGGVDVSLSTADPDPVILESTTSVSGTSASPVVPPNCAILVQKKTGLGGRRNRGRVYVPAGLAAEDQVSNAGIILPAAVTQWDDRWDAFAAATIIDGLDPVLAHQWDPLAGPGPFVPTPITEFEVAPRLATQRRRLR